MFSCLLQFEFLRGKSSEKKMIEFFGISILKLSDMVLFTALYFLLALILLKFFC